MSTTLVPKRGDRSAFIESCKSTDKVTFSAYWQKDPVTRKVNVVKSAEVGFSHPRKEGVTSYIGFPKAEDIAQPAPGVFIIASFGLSDFASMAGVAHMLVYDCNEVPTDITWESLAKPR